MTQRIVLVAALARDRTIGKDGGLPWHYPDDLKRFKSDTLGTALVMGRRTFEAIGRPLPGRPNVIVTRDPAALTARHGGVEAACDWPSARELAAAHGTGTVSVVGGGEIYALALPEADELLLTFVPEDGGGDTFFPEWDSDAFREAERESFAGLERVRLVRR